MQGRSIFRLLLYLAIGVGGCAIENATGDPPSPSGVPTPHRQHSQSIAALRINEVDVQLATETEVLEAQNRWGAFWNGLGTYTLTLGAVAPLNPPAAIAGAMLGGVLFSAAAIQGHLEEQRRDAIKQASDQMDFPRKLQEVLESRLVSEQGTDDNRRKLEVMLLAYGFVATKGTKLCFNFDAKTRMTEGGRELVRDRIIMTSHERTPDVPPPRCHTLYDLGTEHGKLVGEILAETTEIVTAIVIKHLTGC